MKVFVSTHPFGESNPEPRRIIEEKGIHLECNPYGRKIRREELIKHIQDKDILIAGTEKLDKEVFDSAPNLKLIARVGIGIDGIDFDETKKRNIVVTYTPDAVTNAVAEMTVCNMLNLARLIPTIDKGMHNGKWKRLIGFELRRKKIGIIGFGRIGQAVAKLLQGFSCSLYANDISPDQEIASKYDVQFVRKDFIFRECDVVTLHIPETPLTRKLINEESLMKMKTGALLLNTSRGGVVDEAGLVEAIRKGHLGGAALDVYEKEPYIMGSLCGLDNVILTCHSGSCSNEARYLMEMGAAQEAVAFYENRPPISLVPEETIIGERAKTVVPINAEWHELSNTAKERSDPRYKLYRKRWGQYPAYFIVGKYPLNIDIEVVQRHDISSPLCFDYVTKPVEREDCTFMDMELFKRIIQEISGYEEPTAVKLGFRGDPALHPDLKEMIRLCGEAGVIETIVSTHVSENLAQIIEELSKSKLDVLTLYMNNIGDGGKPLIEEKESIDFLCDALDKIKRQRALGGRYKPKVRLVAEADPGDAKTVSHFKRFWAIWADVLAVTEKMDAGNGFQAKDPYPWACSKPWQRIVLTGNGNILSCNYDVSEEAVLSHFPMESIEEAWRGQLLSDIREKHMRNRSHEVQLCSQCSFRRNEIFKMNY